MRGKRDSAVRRDVATGAEPATASESAHWREAVTSPVMHASPAKQAFLLGISGGCALAGTPGATPGDLQCTLLGGLATEPSRCCQVLRTERIRLEVCA